MAWLNNESVSGDRVSPYQGVFNACFIQQRGKLPDIFPGCRTRVFRHVRFVSR